MVLSTPPCNAFSRAVFANKNGPRPIRDRMYPKGFPWLDSASKKLADEGNILSDFTVSIAEAALEANVLFLIEFPEDLGKSRLGTPASLWQREDLRKLPGAIRGAFYQCDWGAADYAKPTGSLTSAATFAAAPGFHVGWPTFYDNGYYSGPLPASCGHNHQSLIGRDGSGDFRTAPTGAYPPALCRRFAELLFAAWVSKQAAKSLADAPAVGAVDGPARDLEAVPCINGKNFTSMPVMMDEHPDLLTALKEAATGPGSVPCGRGRTFRWGLFKGVDGVVTTVGLSGARAVTVGRVNSVLEQTLSMHGHHLQ